MPNSSPPSLRCSGEITERAELLNGAVQLTLDGRSEDPEGRWACEVALSWRLGRAGAVALDEGDLTLESGDRELVAILDHGTAELDAETGSVEIDATFTIEGATGIDVDSETPLPARFEVGAESWRGELRVRLDEPYGS